jgi:hypothetical protein
MIHYFLLDNGTTRIHTSRLLINKLMHDRYKRIHQFRHIKVLGSLTNLAQIIHSCITENSPTAGAIHSYKGFFLSFAGASWPGEGGPEDRALVVTE